MKQTKIKSTIKPTKKRIILMFLIVSLLVMIPSILADPPANPNLDTVQGFVVNITNDFVNNVSIKVFATTRLAACQVFPACCANCTGTQIYYTASDGSYAVSSADFIYMTSTVGCPALAGGDRSATDSCEGDILTSFDKLWVEMNGSTAVPTIPVYKSSDKNKNWSEYWVDADNAFVINFTLTDYDPVITPLNCISNPANISDSILCRVNVTDDIGIDTIIGNVTHVNGTLLGQTLSCAGTSLQQECNFTFTETTLPGNYNVIWWVNDTSNNVITAPDLFNIEAPFEVTLISPANGASIDASSTTFMCNATGDNNLTSITLYTNLGGSWGVTANISVNGTQANATFTNISGIAQGSTYVWNCLATDELGFFGFAPSNFSFSRPAAPGGSGGGGGGGKGGFICNSSWDCSEWSPCTSRGIQYRTCVDVNQCSPPNNVPARSRSCVPHFEPIYYFGNFDLTPYEYTNVTGKGEEWIFTYKNINHTFETYSISNTRVLMKFDDDDERHTLRFDDPVVWDDDNRGEYIEFTLNEIISLGKYTKRSNITGRLVRPEGRAPIIVNIITRSLLLIILLIILILLILFLHVYRRYLIFKEIERIKLYTIGELENGVGLRRIKKVLMEEELKEELIDIGMLYAIEYKNRLIRKYVDKAIRLRLGRRFIEQLLDYSLTKEELKALFKELCEKAERDLDDNIRIGIRKALRKRLHLIYIENILDTDGDQDKINAILAEGMDEKQKEKKEIKAKKEKLFAEEKAMAQLRRAVRARHLTGHPLTQNFIKIRLERLKGRRIQKKLDKLFKKREKLEEKLQDKSHKLVKKLTKHKEEKPEKPTVRPISEEEFIERVVTHKKLPKGVVVRRTKKNRKKRQKNKKTTKNKKAKKRRKTGKQKKTKKKVKQKTKKKPARKKKIKKKSKKSQKEESK